MEKEQKESKEQISCSPYQGEDFYCKCYNTNYSGPIDVNYVMSNILQTLQSIDQKLNILIDSNKS